MIAKRLDSPYEPGRRGGAWVKIKNKRRQELVIGGWFPGEGKRESRIGALLVGYHDRDGNLRYGGRVGTGFKERDLDDLEARLAPLRRKTSPFRGDPKPPRGAISEEDKNLYRMQPPLTMEPDLFRWSCRAVVDAVREVAADPPPGSTP